MKYELTIFKNQFDNKTHRRVAFETWEEFRDTLYHLSTIKGQKGGNNSSPLITPAVFQLGTTRSNATVSCWAAWACVDVDDFFVGSTVDQLKEELHSRFGQYDYIVYNTASSREEHLKFRIVFRLDEAVENETIKAFWHALNTELGEIGDPQTKDLARMYYVPADYPGAYSFIFHNEGEAINVSELLAKHPFTQRTGKSFLDRLPPALAQAVVDHRKNKLDNTNVRWSSYHDCPYWPRMLAVEYRNISGTGWYHKMYQIMVATAGNAVKNGYPITANQIAELCAQFDRDTGNWYENRPLLVEADRALEYIYRNG